MIAAKHLDFAIMKGSDDAIKEAVVAAVMEAWKEVDEQWSWRLIQSILHRVAAILAARGSYTRH